MLLFKLLFFLFITHLLSGCYVPRLALNRQ